MQGCFPTAAEYSGVRIKTSDLATLKYATSRNDHHLYRTLNSFRPV